MPISRSAQTAASSVEPHRSPHALNRRLRPPPERMAPKTGPELPLVHRPCCLHPRTLASQMDTLAKHLELAHIFARPCTVADNIPEEQHQGEEFKGGQACSHDQKLVEATAGNRACSMCRSPRHWPSTRTVRESHHRPHHRRGPRQPPLP